MIRLRGGAATDAGRVRANNQDRFALVDGALYAVADGMGGHRGGEVAAGIVADGLLALGQRATAQHATGQHALGQHTAGQQEESQLTPKGVTRPEALNSAVAPLTTQQITDEIVSLNSKVLDVAANDEDLYGMGTTLTAVALAETTTANGTTETIISVLNIGDSRTYLLRNGELQQLTEDHSVVADLIRSGEITPEQARTHRQRSVVTRALGVENAVEIDVIEVLPSPGMRYMLCSDGLTGEVPDEMIGSILRRLADPTDAARELVRLAVERGGRDNVSVVVVDVVDDSGHDEAAARASSAMAPSDASSFSIRQTGPGGHGGHGPITTKSSTAKSVRTHENDKKGRRKKPVRKPFALNLRVLLFLAVLALLGAVVFLVLKNAPDTVDPLVPGSDIVVTTETTLPETSRSSTSRSSTSLSSTSLSSTSGSNADQQTGTARTTAATEFQAKATDPEDTAPTVVDPSASTAAALPADPTVINDFVPDTTTVPASTKTKTRAKK